MTWAMELGAIKDKVPKQKEILNAPRLQVIKRNTCCCSSVVSTNNTDIIFISELIFRNNYGKVRSHLQAHVLIQGIMVMVIRAPLR